MKKIVLCIALCGLTTVATSFKSSSSQIVEVKGEICFKIKNDTGGSVTLHTGKGTAPMTSGSVKEFCIEEGKTLHYAEKGQKGKVILTASAKKHSGKTFKLSEL